MLRPSPLRLWLALTTSKKQHHDSRPTKSKNHTTHGRGKEPSTALTPGNGLLPPELLLQIFASLDFLSLLCCRHVSRLWAASLPTSFTSQYSTYQPLSNPAIMPNLHIKIHFKIRVTRHFQHDACAVEGLYFSSADTRLHQTRLRLHPLIAELEQTMIFAHRRPSSSMFVPLFPQLCPAPVFPWKPLPQENWKCMEVSVPPITKVTVVCYLSNVQGGRNREVEKRREISHGGKVMVGRVVGEVEDMVAWTLKDWFYDAVG